MKKNSKKRVLLSSVAMLMVGAVSLGTATYAWFTTNTQATAYGVNVKTTKQSSLEISDKSRDYSTTFEYLGVQGSMIPASSLNGADWFEATATQGSNYASTTATKIKNLNASYVYRDQLNIKNTGSNDVNNINIEVKGFNSAEYLRFALVPVDNKGTNQSIPEGTKFADHVYGLDATPYVPIAAEGAIIAEGETGYDQQTKITPKAVGTSVFKIKLDDIAGEGFTLKPDKEYHFNLYVWFEGQDTDCLNAKAGQGTANGENQTPNGLTFVVTGDPVKEA